MDLENSQISRRNMLVAGAAAMTAVAFGSRAMLAVDAPAAPGAADPFDGLPLGVQSYTFRDRSFPKALEAIKELGLSRVEIFPGHLTGISPPEAKKMCVDAGITITAYGVVPFSKDDAANRKLFELAAYMGIPHLTCDPSPDAFDSLDKLTEEFKITADIHDHGPGHRWGQIKTIAKALQGHSKMIGLCNDTGHFIRAGENPLGGCLDFGPRMHAMHLKDFKKKGNGGWEDCTLGDGGLPLEDILKWLVKNDFRGDLSIEYEAGNPLEVCKEDITRITKGIAQYLSERPQAK